MTTEPTNADIQSSVTKLVEEVKSNPSNADLLEAFQNHASEDATFQADTTKVHEAMNTRMDSLATKEDVRSIFAEELKNFFKISGMNTKTFIITAATIIGALLVIFGGLKSFLAWIGIGFIK